MTYYEKTVISLKDWQDKLAEIKDLRVALCYSHSVCCTHKICHNCGKTESEIKMHMELCTKG